MSLFDILRFSSLRVLPGGSDLGHPGAFRFAPGPSIRLMQTPKAVGRSVGGCNSLCGHRRSGAGHMARIDGLFLPDACTLDHLRASGPMHRLELGMRAEVGLNRVVEDEAAKAGDVRRAAAIGTVLLARIISVTGAEFNHSIRDVIIRDVTGPEELLDKVISCRGVNENATDVLKVRNKSMAVHCDLGCTPSPYAWCTSINHMGASFSELHGQSAI